MFDDFTKPEEENYEIENAHKTIKIDCKSYKITLDDYPSDG